MSDTATTTAPEAKTRAPAKMAAVGIGVADMARSVKFYTEVMGMAQLQVINLPHLQEIVLGYNRDVSVVLMHWLDGSNPSYGNNPVKLVFNSDDPKAIFDRMRAAGHEITREPEVMPEFHNMISGLGKDPDGYVIELLKPSA
jgi:predicted enzyme related to lactoylglutathione lyase